VFPWDKPETFCLAAAEAQALGLPIITRKVGALQERCIDKGTGYIASDEEALVQCIITLLQDNTVWYGMHHMLQTPHHVRWDAVAARWNDVLCKG
jgi:glycosyltransferase involved in cell wall biosynthesis